MIPIIFTAILAAILAFLLAVSLASFFALLRGCFYLRRFARGQLRDDRTLLLKSPLVPGVSLVAVVTDASKESREFVRRLLEVHYGNHELVLVLDGLAAEEVDVWKQEFRLSISSRAIDDQLPAAPIRCLYEPGEALSMIVVDKERGGEADSRNAATNVAALPLLGIVDQSAEFRADAFLRLARCLLEDPENTLAVCGTAPPPLGKGLAARFGAIETFRTWLGRCGSLADRNMASAAPGCSMLLRRDAVLQAGGFRAGTLELFLRLHKVTKTAGKAYRIAFVPEPLSYVRPPASFSALRAAVRADQREIAGALRSGTVGAPGFPSLFTTRLLRPLLETLAYILVGVGLGLHWIQLDMALLVAIVTIGMGTLLSMAAVVFREGARVEGAQPDGLVGLFFAAIPENLGYRQFRNLWLLAGLFQRDPRAAS